MRNKAFLVALMMIVLLPGLVLAQNIYIKGGTVITVTKGTIEEGNVLIKDGKIAAVGKNVKCPPGVKVIDARGKYIIPGIIDAHSHMALDGDINESTNPVTAQVRMRDAIDFDDPVILQALGGGVVAAKLMHGSANVIGGLNITVKLKWKKPGEEWFIPDVHKQLKMAYGENPKRTYGSRGQMPSTRMGNAHVLRNTFVQAQEYMRKWAEYEKAVKESKEAKKPKRDLKLETLVNLMEGKMNVDFHCYRADGIANLLSIADEFGFRVEVLSHGLEAYKIPEIVKRHNASVSTFADGWGYKMEAFDGNPYNVPLLYRYGVNVLISSDSNNTIRRLYIEAAKAMKYGDLTPEEAIRLITLNPAKALGLDKRMGSIEEGKDGDIAIFDRHPMDTFTKCVMTVIEGEVYFDIEKYASSPE
jgi:imidazolonepropionase-like amidohydrolase